MGDERHIARAIAAAVGLAEGEAGVRAVIDALARMEPVSIRRIGKAVDLPVPIVAAVCAELRKRGLAAQERPARLTPAGRAVLAAGALRVPAGGRSFDGEGRDPLPRELDPVVRRVARAARSAPFPRLELDQCHCTVETKLRRVLALHDAGALVGRRILILGDDDLTSVAIESLVGRFGSAATVAELGVLDLDPNILAFVRMELTGAPFPLSCSEHDLRRPLPLRLRRRFDTVVTDPPYTVAGARLFLSRAAEASAGPGARVFLSFGSRRPEAGFRVQQAIAEMGFAIRRLVRDFNHYAGAGVNGGTSHLYELVATSELRPSVTGTFDGPLYTADALETPIAGRAG